MRWLKGWRAKPQASRADPPISPHGGTDNPALTDDQLLDAMIADPILINRLIVATKLGVKLCRPSETLLDILPAPQQGEFRKKGSELVIDRSGRRVPRVA